MKLFDKNYRWTSDATHAESVFLQAIRPAWNSYIAQGASPRELAHILCHAILTQEITTVLDKTLLSGESEEKQTTVE